MGGRCKTFMNINYDQKGALGENDDALGCTTGGCWLREDMMMMIGDGHTATSCDLDIQGRSCQLLVQSCVPQPISCEEQLPSQPIGVEMRDSLSSHSGP